LGDFDAKKLADGFSFFAANDLQNLGVGEAICRIERSEYDFNLRTLPLPNVEPDVAKRRRERVVAGSRERYASRKSEVDACLLQTVAPPRTEQATEVKRPRKEKLEPQQEKPEKPGRTSAPSHVPARPPEEEPVKVTPPAMSTLGRGGPQHKYLQELVKRWAMSRGYHTVIEKPILDGLGSVDVGLEKDGHSIACEICVTTTVEHEVGNVQKCLAAGFDRVVLISSEHKMIAKAKEAVRTAIAEEQQKQVEVLTPEEFFAFMEALEAGAADREETVRGYKVKVRYQPVGEDEKKAKKQAISHVIVQALRRFKNSPKG
jgi:hypothetical protein